MKVDLYMVSETEKARLFADAQRGEARRQFWVPRSVVPYIKIFRGDGLGDWAKCEVEIAEWFVRKHLAWLLGLVGLLMPCLLSAADVTVRWPAGCENFSYVLEVGRPGRAFLVETTVVNEVTVSNLYFGNEYWFGVRAVDTVWGIEGVTCWTNYVVLVERWLTNSVEVSTDGGGSWKGLSNQVTVISNQLSANSNLMFRGRLEWNRIGADPRVMKSDPSSVTSHQYPAPPMPPELRSKDE